MDIGYLHPHLTHFPVALFIVSWICDLLGRLFKRNSLHTAGFVNLIVAAVGAGLSIATGLAAEQNVPPMGAVRDVVGTHQTLAFVFSGVVTVMLMWRISCRGKFPADRTWLYLTVGVVGVAAVLLTAHMGGRLVFEFGTGVMLPGQR